VIVTDAAGNSSTVFASTITTNNPPTNTSPPVLINTSRSSGPPLPGDVLAIDPGAWTPSSSFSYAWQACAPDGSACHTLQGQNSAQYEVSAGDAGEVQVGELTARDSAGEAHQTADTSAPVANNTGGGMTVGPDGNTGLVVVAGPVGRAVAAACLASPCWRFRTRRTGRSRA
jgi:hypothetical protein